MMSIDWDSKRVSDGNFVISHADKRLIESIENERDTYSLKATQSHSEAAQQKKLADKRAHEIAELKNKITELEDTIIAKDEALRNLTSSSPHIVQNSLKILIPFLAEGLMSTTKVLSKTGSVFNYERCQSYTNKGFIEFCKNEEWQEGDEEGHMEVKVKEKSAHLFIALLDGVWRQLHIEQNEQCSKFTAIALQSIFQIIDSRYKSELTLSLQIALRSVSKSAFVDDLVGALMPGGYSSSGLNALLKNNANEWRDKVHVSKQTNAYANINNMGDYKEKSCLHSIR